MAAIGKDVKFAEALLTTGKWAGTVEEMLAQMNQTAISLSATHLPIREAADLIYTAILFTIKLIRFARLPPTCGGPIENCLNHYRS